eukprot:3941266-Rhodomonas_salina.6
MLPVTKWWEPGALNSCAMHGVSSYAFAMRCPVLMLATIIPGQHLPTVFSWTEPGTVLLSPLSAYASTVRYAMSCAMCLRSCDVTLGTDIHGAM